MATTTTSHKRCQERPKHDEWFQNRRKEELYRVIQKALLHDDDDPCFFKYMKDMYPNASLSEDLKFMCHNSDNSDKKKKMILEICNRYTSEESNTTELCVREFCAAHAAYLLESGDEPCILFKQ